MADGEMHESSGAGLQDGLQGSGDASARLKNGWHAVRHRWRDSSDARRVRKPPSSRHDASPSGRAEQPWSCHSASARRKSRLWSCSVALHRVPTRGRGLVRSRGARPEPSVTFTEV